MIKDIRKQAIVYQIYPKSFCDSNNDGHGDIQGIISKLDYIKDLGVNTIWLSPIFESPNFDNGYDISDYQKINPEYGTLENVDQLINEAHKRGIKVVFDLVVNHSSHQHEWFKNSISSKSSKYRDYYIWRDGKEGKEPNNWGALFGGSAWTYDEKTNQYYLGLFSPQQPDLNWENPNLRKEVYKMMKWWLNRGIDGFRMDVISLISKPQNFPDGKLKKGSQYAAFHPLVSNGPRIHEFLQEMRNEVLNQFDTISIGEASAVTLDEARKYASLDRSELDMVFQFEHMDLDGGESFKWNDRKINVVELKQCLSKWQTGMEGKAWNTLFFSNHDQPRVVSRLGDEGQYREKSAKMLATCFYLMKGTPFIFQGDELSMTNTTFKNIDEVRDLESINAYHDFVENKMFTSDQMLRYISLKGRDNARLPMQWNDGIYGGFSEAKPWIKCNDNASVINAEDQLSRADSVYHYFKKLIELRQSKNVFIDGKYELINELDENVYAYLRTDENETILIVCNFTDQKIKFDCDFECSEVLIRNDENSTFINDSMLNPYETIVLKKSINY